MHNSLATQKQARRPSAKSQPLSNHSPEKKTPHNSNLLRQNSDVCIEFILKNGRRLCIKTGSNWDVCEWREHTNKETGELVQEWRSFAYYSSLEFALNRIFDEKLQTCGAKDLATLQNELHHIRKELIDCYEVAIETR